MYLDRVYPVLRNFLFIMLLLPLSILSYAGDASGLITKLSVQNGKVYLKIDGSHEKDSCATNGNWDYAFSLGDANDNGTGKALLSMALSAYIAKINITVISKSGNLCEVFSGMEDTERLILQ